jgi:hypothetical protein
MKGVMFLYNSLTFFSHNIDKEFKINFEMVGGFLSAIETFAQNISNENIQGFEFGENRIHYKKVNLDDTNTIMIIGFASKKEEEKKSNESLEFIIEKFFEAYKKDDILCWDGDVMRFCQFQEILHKNFSDSGKRIKESIFKRKK